MARDVLVLFIALILIGMLLPSISETHLLTVPEDYPTIQSAIDAAHPGDLVYIRAGRYIESVFLNKPLHIVGEDAAQVIVQSPDLEHDALTVDIRQGSILIEGVKAVFGNTGFRIEVGEHAKVSLLNVISNYNVCGVSTSGRGTFSIHNSIIIENGDIGLRLEATSCEVVANEILFVGTGILLVGDVHASMSDNTVAMCERAIDTYTCACNYPDTPETFAGTVKGGGNRLYGTKSDLCPTFKGVRFDIGGGSVDITQLQTELWPEGFIRPEWPPKVRDAVKLYNQGKTLRKRGKHSDAFAAYAVGFSTAADAEIPWLAAQFSNELGLLCVDTACYQTGLEFLQAALPFFASRGAELCTAMVLGSLGSVYGWLGRYEEALSAYQEARDIWALWSVYESTDGCRFMFAAVGGAMGLLHCKQRDYTEALEPLACYIDILDEFRGMARTVWAKTLFTQAALMKVYRDFVLTKAKVEGLAKALLYAERAKARTLTDMMETAMTQHSEVMPSIMQTASTTLHALSAQEHTQQEFALGSRISSDLMSGDFQTASLTARASLVQSTQRTQEKYEAMLTQLERDHPELGETLSVNPDRLWKHFLDVQKELGEGTVALEYFVTNEETIVWVITKEGIQTASWIPVSGTVLAQHVRAFREELNTTPLPGEEPTRLLRVRELGRDLYDLLIAPVKGYIQGAEHLVIVPSDVLFYLPFGALYNCPGCEGRDLLGGEFLIEQYSISYAPSLSSLYWPFQHRGDGTYESVLSVGNPTGDLTHAEEEARSVAALFPRATTFIGEQGTEAAVKDALGTYSYDAIHLSTHGLFDQVLPLVSQVVLLSGDGQDGALYAGEILGLPLSVELVVLSACQTALPPELTEETAGLVVGDEIQGLGQALFVAGAPSAVLTLWNVNDRSTRYLMEHMYQKLMADVSKGEALRQAQLSLLRDPLYRHPCFWAPFVLYGDWR